MLMIHLHPINHYKYINLSKRVVLHIGNHTTTQMVSEIVNEYVFIIYYYYNVYF
jgi:hypothetical protein